MVHDAGLLPLAVGVTSPAGGCTGVLRGLTAGAGRPVADTPGDTAPGQTTFTPGETTVPGKDNVT